MKYIFKILLIIFVGTLILGCDSNDTSKEYTVEFYLNDTIYETQKVKYGSRIEKPEEPVADGLIFDGWYVDGEKWLFTSGIVLEDMRLDGKFSDGLDEEILGVEPVYQGMSIESQEVYNISRKKNNGFKDSIDNILEYYSDGIKGEISSFI